MHAQIDKDAGLRAALAEICVLSAALRPLRRAAPVASALRPDIRRFSASFIPAAAAAVAIIAGAFLYNAADGVKSPLDRHQTFDGRSYSVLAEGMDRGKFTAIFHLRKILAENKTDDGAAVVALRQATDRALPCA